MVVATLTFNVIGLWIIVISSMARESYDRSDMFVHVIFVLTAALNSMALLRAMGWL